MAGDDGEEGRVKDDDCQPTTATKKPTRETPDFEPHRHRRVPVVNVEDAKEDQPRFGTNPDRKCPTRPTKKPTQKPSTPTQKPDFALKLVDGTGSSFVVKYVHSKGSNRLIYLRIQYNETA